MELFELEDIFNRITFHFQQIESNLVVLRDLSETSKLFSSEPFDYISTILRSSYSEIRDKYETEKSKLLRGEENV